MSLAAATNSLAVENTASIDDCGISCDASSSATIVTARNVDSAAADVTAANLDNDRANSIPGIVLETIEEIDQSVEAVFETITGVRIKATTEVAT